MSCVYRTGCQNPEVCQKEGRCCAPLATQLVPLASKDVAEWPEFDDFVREAMRDKARPSITNKTEAYGHMSDEWVANRVRMLMRTDLEFEPICSAGRDRIMRLSMEVAELRGILAARGSAETLADPDSVAHAAFERLFEHPAQHGEVSWVAGYACAIREGRAVKTPTEGPL